MFENLEKNKICDYILENYPKIGRIKTIKKIRHTNINSINFLIDSYQESYVLRKILDDSTPVKLEKICEILEFTHNGCKVSKPIINSSGKFVDTKNKIFLTKFYSGSFFNGKNNEIISAAENLALLHKKLAEIKIDYTYNPYSKFYNILSNKELLKIKNKARNDILLGKSFIKNYTFLENCIEENIEEEEKIKLKNFPLQLIHNDLHPKNVIFNQGRVVVILDFNSMKKGNIGEDVSFVGLRFAVYNTKLKDAIKKTSKLFEETYCKKNPEAKKQLYFSKYFLRKKFLERLSFILRQRYFHKSDLWSRDFNKNIKFLKLSLSIYD